MKLNAEFQGAPNGEIYPITYAAGDECPPELEDAARSLGVLDEPVPVPVAEPEPEPEPAAEPELSAATRKAKK